MNQIAQEQASTLLEHFAAAAASVVSQIAGSEVTVQPELLLEPLDAATLQRIPITGSLEGLLEIGLDVTMTARFASLLMGETLTEDADTVEVTQDQKDAAAELLQQISGNAADRLRKTFGPMELKAAMGERDAGTGQRHMLTFTGAAVPLEMELHIVELQPKAEEQAEPAQAAAPATAAAPIPEQEPVEAAQLSTINARNLDLLLDIELGVTLRFGTRQMLLKDILDLSSGSVIELDRKVHEPVDLFIDGRPIAHGEVVIVGGHYGLRVLQVASPGEKIACLPQ